MTDSITCTVTIDLQDLHSYTQVGEDEWRDQPSSLSDAVVSAAAQHLVKELVKDALLTKIRDQITKEVVKAEVEKHMADVLAKPIRKTDDWGNSTGPEVTITEMIDAQITKQLTRGRDRYGNDRTVLDAAIAELVNARLQTDLAAAFATARNAMIEAATEAGQVALKKAVAVALR